MNRLPLVLAACYEAIRLRDLVMFMSKEVREDTPIPYTTWDDAGNIAHKQHMLKKGSHIILDTPSMQRNPFVWVDPMEYIPARHLTGEAKANFVGFSLGPRQCIGKRFAEVEMVAFLSHVIKDYKIFPAPRDGESLEEMKEKLMACTEELTLRPLKFGLKFEQRAGRSL